jgi:hypothetical protein
MLYKCSRRQKFIECEASGIQNCYEHLNVQQGDQIGLTLAYWVMFLTTTKVTRKCGLLFPLVKFVY